MDDQHAHVMLDQPGILTAVEAHPEVCSYLWWGQRLAAVRVNLDTVSADLVTELLADAWEHKAPERLLDERSDAAH